MAHRIIMNQNESYTESLGITWNLQTYVGSDFWTREPPPNLHWVWETLNWTTSRTNFKSTVEKDTKTPRCRTKMETRKCQLWHQEHGLKTHHIFISRQSLPLAVEVRAYIAKNHCSTRIVSFVVALALIVISILGMINVGKLRFSAIARMSVEKDSTFPSMGGQADRHANSCRLSIFSFLWLR